MTDRAGVLVDYHNKEADLLTGDGRRGRYVTADGTWPQNVTNPHLFHFVEMPLVLTYAVEGLLCGPHGRGGQFF